jgi:capsid protein
MTALLSAPRRRAKAPVLLDHRGEPVQRALHRVSTNTVLKARYDAAQYTAENRQLWSLVDSLSAASANSPDVRKTLRERSRYEVANNSYLSGMIETLINDVVGTGPTLQVMEPDPEFNEIVEQAFSEWAEAARLDEKLRTMEHAETADGESFALLSGHQPSGHPIPLDLRLYETDQVSLPWLSLDDPQETDGIQLDEHGDPVSYSLLNQHPGDFGLMNSPTLGHTDIPAHSMLHLFRCCRPGQVRGVPLFTPSLPLFGELRRFILAVIAAAETAADFAAVLESDAPPTDDDEALELDPFSVAEIERRLMTSLPRGYKLSQLKAEQPSTTLEMFVGVIVGQAARPACMPRNVALGDSSGMNFTSGRLDHKKYDKFIAVTEHRIDCRVLNPVMRAWWPLAVLLGIVPDLPADSIRRIPRFRWNWPGSDPIDPNKESTSQATDLSNYSTNLSIICGRKGLDWEEVLRQRAREKRLMEDLGLTDGDVLPSVVEDDEDE